MDLKLHIIKREDLEDYSLRHRFCFSVMVKEDLFLKEKLIRPTIYYPDGLSLQRINLAK